jgi:3-oxoacyl-[acyl-carrier-protein] synthase II
MKVFVTGMGALTSLGLNVDDTFSALLDDKSGVRRFPEWEHYNGLHSLIAGPVADYDVSSIPRATRRTMSRMSEMAFLATSQALRQSRLPAQDLNLPRVLLIIGSTTGSPLAMEVFFRKLEERGGPDGQVSTSFFKIMSHSVAANVASALGYHGALLSPSSACTTSAQAMIIGWEMIRSGLYDIVIAGGAEELHYTTAAIFDIVFAASRKYNGQPDLSPRPFDQERDGLVVSEGAAVVVMESEASVRARGATPLAEFCSGAYLCEGSHISQSNASAMSEVMRMTLDRAEKKASDVDYVNAHATGTVHGDLEEARAIGSVFGQNTPVSSLKGHLGHSLAACGTLEVIASIKMMETSTLLPTRNLTHVDTECAGIAHITQKRIQPVRHVLSNNFAFGGMNTSLLISACS